MPTLADAHGLVASNLLAPATLAFLLGLVAALIKSDLRFPEAATSTLAVWLLLAIGLKGGAALAGVSPSAIVGPALATLALGLVTPLTSYVALRRFGRLCVADAAA